MKNRVFLFSIVMFLIAALWWFWLIDKTPEKQKPANIVSMQASESESKDVDALMEKTSKLQVDELKEKASKPIESKPVIDKKMSYLDIYRKYQWALICQPYLNSSFRQKGDDHALVFDYSVHYLAQMTAKQRLMGEPEVASDEQFRRLDAYVVACDGVSEYVEMIESQPAGSLANNEPVTVLLRALMEMKAETQKEKGIKAMLVIQQDIATLQGQIIELHQGENTWTEVEIAAQEQSIKNLMQQIAANVQNVENNDVLNQELKTLMQQLSSQKQKDKTAIKQSVDELLALYAKANVNLNSTDSDVFYLAKTTAEMQADYSGLGVLWYDFFRKEYGVQYATPGESMLQLLGMSARHVFNQAALPAGMLYLCELGEDCGENSLLMTSYCLGFGGLKVNTAACGKDLNGFYGDGYLSPSLMQDVQLILELMEAEYGA